MNLIKICHKIYVIMCGEVEPSIERAFLWFFIPMVIVAAIGIVWLIFESII